MRDFLERLGSAKKPVWIEDVLDPLINFPRHEVADQAKLRTGFGFPIQFQGEVFAVMEFYSQKKSKADPKLLDFMTGIGNLVGIFLRQAHAIQDLKEHQETKTAILNSALDCIVSMDEDGKVVDFTPAAEQTFGYKKIKCLASTWQISL